ncbi:hypothetical protein D3C87_1431310 [compost metagenome]
MWSRKISLAPVDADIVAFFGQEILNRISERQGSQAILVRFLADHRLAGVVCSPKPGYCIENAYVVLLAIRRFDFVHNIVYRTRKQVHIFHDQRCYKPHLKLHRARLEVVN